MDIEQAKKLVEEGSVSSGFHEKNAVMRGLQILAKYEDDISPEFDHDIIWRCRQTNI